LLAERLYRVTPEAAIDMMFAILTEEAGGPRELHALERTTEFFVDEVGDTRLTDRLRAIQSELHDPEEFVNWAIERLQDGSR